MDVKEWTIKMLLSNYNSVFSDICYVNIHNLSNNDRHSNNNWQLGMF